MPHTVSQGYESTLADFIRLCAQAKADDIGYVIVAQPWVLGDT
jgi:hypothetical protein